MSQSSSRPRYRVRKVRSFDASASWDGAEALREFRFPWEAREAPETEFRALWDEDDFHFRFRCEDADLVLGEGENVRERVIGSDRAEIFFAPDLSLDPYYGLEMDPRGNVLAYEARYYRRMNWDWTLPSLEVRAELRPGGYRVEGRVPLAALRELGVLRPGASTMLAGVFRAEFHHDGGEIHQGWMSWVDPGTERPDFHVPSAFGEFELAGTE